MKKIFKLFLITSLCLSLSTIDIYARTDNTEKISLDEIVDQDLNEKIKKIIFEMEGKNLEIDSIDILYDVENNPSYILAEFKDIGYAILAKNNLVISEYNLYVQSPYENIRSIYKYYFGPGEYHSESIAKSGLKNSEELSEIKIANKKILSQNSIKNDNPESTLSMKAINDTDWIGINENKMKRYNWGHEPSLVGDTNGICGTVVSTILLAYYDDYIDNRIVPDVCRQRFANIPGMLYMVMWYNTDMPNPNGTLPYNLSSGINKFFQVYNSNNFNQFPHSYSAKYMLAPVFVSLKEKLEQNIPAAVSLLKFNQSPYGDHWVFVYSYKMSNGIVYYKCIDTWVSVNDNTVYPIDSDNYRAVINDSWTSSFVYLE